jgi:hypothetical protein
VLIHGASPCNVFWQVGSSATLDTTTAFQGNVMALTSISLNNGASVIGRVLARNGKISLINNVLDGSRCRTATTSPSGTPGTTPSGTTPSGTTPPGTTPLGTSPSRIPPSAVTPPERGIPTTLVGGKTQPNVTPKGTARITRVPGEACTDGFTAAVRGRLIKRVVFSLDGRRISSLTRSPFTMFVWAPPGHHMVRARVTFRNATRAKTLALGYRACAAAVLQPLPGPSVFTG